MALPSRGEIWLANLSPTLGHEQSGERPVLIVSNDIFNHGPAGLVLVLPLTATDRGIPIHVPVEPPEGGLTKRSYILCDAVRSISKRRLNGQAWGILSPQTMQKVEDALQILMDL